MAFVTRIFFERELILRVLQGEMEAQVEFYSLVRLYILKICQSHYRLPMADVEDVCQNISISLFRNLAGIEGDVGTWVNAAINGQLAKRKKRVEEGTLGSDIAWTPPVPLELAIGIWEAMQQLDAFCKKLIIAQIIQGCTKAQTAKAAGIPYGSLSSRRKQCLAELFQHYEGGVPCDSHAIPAGKSLP